MKKDLLSYEADKDPLEMILGDWFVALMVFAVVSGIGCAGTRQAKKRAVASQSTAVTEVGDQWVRVSAEPPRYFPAKLPRDFPTDWAHGEWVLASGSLFFVPKDPPAGLGIDPAQLTEEALGMRSKKELKKLAKQNAADTALLVTAPVNPFFWLGAGAACCDDAAW